MKDKKVVDEKECFARLNETKYNALSVKRCKDCSFYKHYKDVKGYEKYLPKDFKRSIVIKDENNC